MTAQITILNKEAVALASDSIATMTSTYGSKQINTNKLFSLSKYHPVGIMVYDNAEFMGFPWETIIKAFRKQLDDKKYGTIQGYANSFVAHLSRINGKILPEKLQEKYFLQQIKRCFHELGTCVERDTNKDPGSISENEFHGALQTFIQHIENHDNLEGIDTYYETRLHNKYDRIIEDFSQLSTNNILKNNLGFDNSIESTRIQSGLRDLCFLIRMKAYFFNGFKSGIVIAGFGEEELFPSKTHILVESVLGNKTKSISDNFSITEECPADIRPYAQTDMVEDFLFGIHPFYDDFISTNKRQMNSTSCSDILDKIKNQCPTLLPEKLDQIKTIVLEQLKKRTEDLQTKKKNFERKYYLNPVLNMVSNLKIEDLANMADTLVSLTSFKRKVTPQSETVGGATDVAVISKYDGFIWVKRKHYFDKDLNFQFFKNYYKNS